MTIVAHELDKIHASYNRLKYSTLIPCNCDTCKGTQEPHFYKLEILEQFRADRQREIQCQKSYKMVEVIRLIDDVLERAIDLHGEEKIVSRPATRPKAVPPTEPEKEVWVSYNWGEESKAIVDQLVQAFQEKGVTIIRDKMHFKYKGRIKEFMERLGRGKCVIAIIGKKYLESKSCMFELVQIAKHGDFYDRIFPIVLSDANIYKPVERIKYVKFWEEKKDELNQAMKGVSQDNLQGIREDIDLYAEIRSTIAELTDILRDTNVLTPEVHSQSGFEDLFNAIAAKLAE